MRVPLSWLKEFVDIALSPQELADRLTMAGFEVDAIEYVGLPGAELPWDPERVLIGNILEVRPHPNADRLVLADVDYGAAEPHTVVTGAPNLFQYRGLGRLSHPLKGVYAKEGSELYDGHSEGKVKIKLKGKPVRGVMSDAMLCSEKELDLSEDHEGILILPDDAPVGTPLRDYLGDVVLEISILPNTARALSILGVAREVAALTGATLRMPAIELDASGPSIESRASVTVEAPELCPRFTLTLSEGIAIKPSPYWMQRRLTLAGMRPISNIVDISNYVMLELGEPNHIFDADQVADQRLIVRLAQPGERLTTLDGKEHELTPDRLLVCDSSGPLSLAGVMGGASSEVRDTTTRVLVEAAIWEPTIIRRTAQAFRLPSEASRRFERGVDPESPPLTQRRLLSLIAQYAGGTAAAGMIDVYPTPWRPRTVDLTPREVCRILGIELSASEIANLLQPLGFECAIVEEQDGPLVRTLVPSYRLDVSIPADLCEEVARMYGYDRLPMTFLADDLPEQRDNPVLTLEQKTRDVMVGAGVDEAITYSLTSMPAVALIDPAAADSTQYLKLENPLTPEREYLRRSLLPTLLAALADNLRERERVALFEIGRVYLPRDGELLPEEPRRLALALAGRRDDLSWQTAKSEQMDFFDLKGVVETLLQRLNVLNQVRFEPLTDDVRFHPGRAAALVKQDGTRLGVLGELHPDLRERLDLPERVTRALAAEFDLDALIAASQPTRYTSISRYPATREDLSFVLDIDTPAERVAAAIRKYAGPDLESLTLWDVYEDPKLGTNKRSLTYQLVFRKKDRTLGEKDMEKIRAKIVRGVGFDVGGTLRA